jgi:hypothetical protein
MASPISVRQALSRLIIDYEESAAEAGEVRARGTMSFGAALEGPPGRLHGGYHTFVRTLPILERISAHAPARTFPCALDVRVLKSLPLEQAVPFEASYRSEGEAWSLTTRLRDTDRLLALARSLPAAPRMDAVELARWRSLHEESSPAEHTIRLFGVTCHLSPRMVWVEAHDPARTVPESQQAALVGPGGTLGPAFVVTQLDMVGAVVRGTLMQHPQFTKRVEIELAVGQIPADARLLCLADGTTMEEDDTSESEPVEVHGRQWGTVRVRVAVVDAAWSDVYATGRITVHPVDPRKFGSFEQIQDLRDGP